jgi:hypothetical protein
MNRLDNDLIINQKNCKSIKNHFNNKLNNIMQLTIENMKDLNDINSDNDKDLTTFFYTNYFYKIKKLDNFFDILEDELVDIKKIIKKYKFNNIDNIDENNPTLNKNEVNNEVNNESDNKLIHKSELDTIFPILYCLFRNN